MGDTGRDDLSPIIPRPRATGRRLVQFKRGLRPADARSILKSTGANAVSVQNNELASAVRSSRNSLLIERLGIAVVGGGLEMAKAVGEQLLAFDEVEDVRPEFFMFAIQGPP